MLGGLLKPKNYSKCKTCLKLIKTRLETIRKKRNAVQKFLKKDIVDLLKNSLDYNAYGRAEGLMVEQNMSACYELIAKFVGCISVHVRELFKQNICPDECKEAIPSLIYAAARFSDLPELRELRTLFQEKFGNTLEPYTSKEFIERLRQNPPSKEMKIQLLHEFAQEFSIEWDRKALEQKLYSPPLSHQEKEKPKHNQQKDYGELKCEKNINDSINSKIYDDHQKDYDELKREKPINDNISSKTDDPWWRMYGSTDNETAISDSSSLDDQKFCSSSIENASEDDETKFKKAFSLKSVPPPYLKEHKELKKSESLPTEKPVPRSVRRRPLKPPPVENTVKDFSKTGGVIDEEEILDGLLMKCMKKQSPTSDKEQSRRHRKSSSSVPKTLRGKSLPQRRMETFEGHGRATSLVPEYVHPSLPEYEDLSARLADLRRT